MIELALLGLLSEQDLHGYELKKQLGELLGPWSAVSFGSLYPALGRLERAGSVRVLVAGDEHEGAAGPDEPTTPMTGALTGELAAFRRLGTKAVRAATATSPEHPSRPRGRRGKKVYAITDAGRARFAELLAEPAADDDRSFALRVAFCRHLPLDERLTLFERRKADLATQLSARRRTGPRRSDPYRRLLGERETRALVNDIAWIDELIAAAQADAAEPDDARPPTDAPAAQRPASAARPRITPSPSLSDLGAHARRARSVKAGTDS
jgi:DNA-binding PadR family transcriptional regulator